MAHIAGYVHAAAAATAGGGGDESPPLLLCQGRATSAADASRRVAALAGSLTQRMGMQVGVLVCAEGMR